MSDWGPSYSAGWQSIMLSSELVDQHHLMSGQGVSDISHLHLRPSSPDSPIPDLDEESLAANYAYMG